MNGGANRSDVLAAWRRRISEITDAEVFSLLADLLTVVIADLKTPVTTNDIEFHNMLLALREECLERHRRGDHYSAEPKGNG